MSDQIIYTPEQEQLITNLIAWYRTRSAPYYSYSGAAGTGKTTVIHEFIEQLGLKEEEYICCAYIGKAVLQLLRHDLPACTIHSLIYHTVVEIVKPGPDDEDQREKQKLTFVLKEQLNSALKLIVVDEATMVNDDMCDKILGFGIPTIFIGDMNQLPPIFGKSSIMQAPNFCLTQIMRQKENDPIVQLSQMILRDADIDYGQYGSSLVVDHYEVDSTLLTGYDQILCATNNTREQLNQVIRTDILNRTSIDPVRGDKVVCRQNDWDICQDGIFLTNGLIGYVTDVSRTKAYRGFYTIAFRPDFMDADFEGVKLDLRYIRADFQERKDYGISRFNKFEYGYAITTHLSQGSEYDRVLFIDEATRWRADMLKKLRYTAITRAKTSITIVLDRQIRRKGFYYCGG